MTPRETAVAAGLALAGLTERDRAYQQIVDPAGAPSEEAAIAHDASSCMLTAAWSRGWRGRFKPDTIQNTLREICGGTGRVPDVDNFADLGDGLWWAACGPHVEHVDDRVVAIERASLYFVTLTVTAGGQRVEQADVDADAFTAEHLGLRCIKQIVRQVAWDGAGWVDQGTGRRVLGVLDCPGAA